MVHQGRPRWYKPDAGLAVRMMLTMFLLGAVYVAFVVVLASVVLRLFRLVLVWRWCIGGDSVLLRRQDRAGLDGRARCRTSSRRRSCTR